VTAKEKAMPRLNDTPTESIPEVAALEETKARMRAFMDSNPDFFRYWDELVAEYNDRVQAADKVVRARGVSCGPFELYQHQTKYDAEYLYQRFGRENFLELGGKLETVEKRSVDKKRVDIAIQTGKIPAEDAPHIRVQSPRYHAPVTIEVPKV
jgi:hypothetical protein